MFYRVRFRTDIADPKILFQNVEFLADLYEGSDTLVELLAGVRGRKLDTDKIGRASCRERV